jgi:hypothetical protein
MMLGAGTARGGGNDRMVVILLCRGPLAETWAR